MLNSGAGSAGKDDKYPVPFHYSTLNSTSLVLIDQSAKWARRRSRWFRVLALALNHFAMKSRIQMDIITRGADSPPAWGQKEPFADIKSSAELEVELTWF